MTGQRRDVTHRGAEVERTEMEMRLVRGCGVDKRDEREE